MTKILVIDDDARDRGLLVAVLEEKDMRLFARTIVGSG